MIKVKLYRDPSAQSVLGTTALSYISYNIFLVLLCRKLSRTTQTFLSSLIFSLTNCLFVWLLD